MFLLGLQLVMSPQLDQLPFAATSAHGVKCPLWGITEILILSIICTMGKKRPMKKQQEKPWLLDLGLRTMASIA